jgi:hypothetical protein
VCIHTPPLHTVCGLLNHTSLLHFNDNRSRMTHDWTGIRLVLLRCLVLCQCVSVRLWTLLSGKNTQPPCNCPLIKIITGLSLHMQSITVLRQGEIHLNTTSSTRTVEVQSSCTEYSTVHYGDVRQPVRPSPPVLFVLCMGG